MKERTHLRLDARLKMRAWKYAAENACSLTDIITRALVEYLERRGYWP